jgi:PDZ domain-containing protein
MGRRYHRAMRRALNVAGIVLLLAVSFAAGWVRLPYYALGPGPSRDVLTLIEVDGAPTYPGSSGHLVLTTVRFRQVTPVGGLVAWLDPEQSVIEDDVLFPPGLTPDEEERRATSEMDQSKIDAAFVVLSRLTEYPAEHPRGALIEQVGEGCPADRRLFPGDVIVRIGDETVDSAGEASELIDAVPPGQPIELRVRAEGEVHAVRIERGRCPGIREPLLGISTIEPFPVEISIESEDVGGPSAGLMWALGLYDLLTEGDLTEGRTIAGTGTIDLEGQVGPIGGILDKVVAAREAGADVLLVPVGNFDELAAADRGAMRVVPVETFDDALAALGASATAT